MQQIDLVQGSDLFVNLGEHRLIIDPKQITVGKTRVIREKILELQKKYSPYNKLSRDPGESGAEWTERYLIFLGQSDIRNEEESDKAYLDRVMKATTHEENLRYYQDVLYALAEEFGQGSKVNDASFELGCMDEILGLIVKILKKCKFPTNDFENN